jgi:hypothetical protein
MTRMYTLRRKDQELEVGSHEGPEWSLADIDKLILVVTYWDEASVSTSKAKSAQSFSGQVSKRALQVTCYNP